MKADLHVHSTASDGTLTPTGLVSRAVACEVDVLAIADHDSVAGIAEALSAAEGTRLTVIPAVELSAVEGSLDVHILGYFVDHTDPVLLRELTDLRGARLKRASAIVAALREAGYSLDLRSVLALTDGGAVGRSHIARALVHAGHAETMAEAFQNFIGRDRPFYVAKDTRSAVEVIGMLRSNGAIPVLAHPGITCADALIPALVDAGLEGIEAYHADHTPEDRERYSRMATSLGLLVTGGTDFHGPEAPNPDLGHVDLPFEVVERLLRAGAERGR